jgi:hypothetical protein
MSRAKALFERKDRPGDWTDLIDQLYDECIFAHFLRDQLVQWHREA